MSSHRKGKKINRALIEADSDRQTLTGRSATKPSKILDVDLCKRVQKMSCSGAQHYLTTTLSSSPLYSGTSLTKSSKCGNLPQHILFQLMPINTWGQCHCLRHVVRDQKIICLNFMSGTPPTILLSPSSILIFMIWAFLLIKVWYLGGSTRGYFFVRVGTPKGDCFNSLPLWLIK